MPPTKEQILEKNAEYKKKIDERIWKECKKIEKSVLPKPKKAKVIDSGEIEVATLNKK